MTKLLETAYAFTPAERLLNQQGHLSPRQQTLLAEYRKTRTCGGYAASVGIGGTLLLFGGVIFFVEEARTLALPSYLVVIGLLALIFLASLIYGVVSTDLRSGKISVAEGPAKKKSRPIRTRQGVPLGKAFEVTIGRTLFRVETQKRFDAFEAGTAYRVYYIRNSGAHFVLSMEKI